MLTPHDAWQATLGQLQLQLNRSTFDTWLRGSELLSYADGEYTVRVRHAYAKDWLEQHLAQQITQTLSNLTQSPARVNFVVHLPKRTQFQPPTGPLFAAASNLRPKTSEPCPPSDSHEWDPRFADVRHTSSSVQPAASLPLNSQYTFDSFVVGPNNQLASAAALAVAESPTSKYNPLVIYGGTGLGKTHLLHAIGQTCREAGERVLYVTAEAFTNELVAAIRTRKTEDVRERYRNVDVILLDDIEFMAGKTSTEEEFYHTFNAIFNQGGQVVITCDRHPRALEQLDTRLRSRLQGGLPVELFAPEPETRLAILHAKSIDQNMPLPDDVAYRLANQPTQNVRELEGLLTQLIARATLTQQPITSTLLDEVLNPQAVRRPARRRARTVKQVLEATATYHQLSLDDLLSKSRTREIAHARQIAMYIAREETAATLPQIGEALGGRDHTTVLYAHQKVAKSVASDGAVRRAVDDIRHQLYLSSED